MVWRRGASDGFNDAPEQATPWKAAIPEDQKAIPQRVVLEGYDDELTPDELAGKPTPDAEARRLKRRAQLRHAADLGLFALAVIGALAGVAVGWMHIMEDPLADAHAYFEAASRLNAGQPLYPAGIDPSGNHIYLYPPLLAVVLRPLALLPFEAFALFWELVVVASFVMLVRHLGVRRKSTWIAIGILGVPIAWALTVAQAHIPMTLLMALGQPWSIAIAANMKIFPALLILYWLGRREFESAVVFLIWCVLIALAQLVVEPAGSFAFFNNVGFAQLGEVRNISPYIQSPLIWAGLLMVGGLVVLLASRTRWGWALAVTLATLAPPRLLVYMLTSLLAGIRQPKAAGQPDPDDLSDAAVVYGRAAR